MRVALVVFITGVAAFVALIAYDIATAYAKPRGETRYQQARRIINAVFPDTTERAALRVVACETGHSYSPWAKGRAPYYPFGWWQFIVQNDGRRISFAGRSMRVDWDRMWQPWYATRAAWILSRGGTNFSEWSCRP